ncbi:hypothetical protein Tco_0953393 [Tanacetum coccineum]|uniref:Uncharacterized protein n=1 Tax=Tanacetum coccineum TaxID=301880 RepID=A0ABQ5E045_9ASTR
MAEIGCNWARIGPSKSSQSLSIAHKWAADSSVLTLTLAFLDFGLDFAQSFPFHAQIDPRLQILKVFESAQLSFDMALRSALERIVTASGPGFGNWQWRLATLPFSFGGLGLSFFGMLALWVVLPLMMHMCGFNHDMKMDLLSNLRWLVGNTKGWITLQTGSVVSSLMALYFLLQCRAQLAPKSLGGILMGTMLYHAPVLLVSSIGITPCVIPDRHMFLVWDLGGPIEVDMGLVEAVTKPYVLAAVIDAAQHKCGKYMDMCAAIGYRTLGHVQRFIFLIGLVFPLPKEWEPR